MFCKISKGHNRSLEKGKTNLSFDKPGIRLLQQMSSYIFDKPKWSSVNTVAKSPSFSAWKQQSSRWLVTNVFWRKSNRPKQLSIIQMSSFSQTKTTKFQQIYSKPIIPQNNLTFFSGNSVSFFLRICSVDICFQADHWLVFNNNRCGFLLFFSKMASV